MDKEARMLALIALGKVNSGGGLDGKDGYTPQKGIDYWTDEDKKEIIGYTKEICIEKNQGTENVGKILVVGTDGNLTLTDMPEGTGGDVIGVLDESNNILLSGDLADGTYTLKYENEDGTYSEIGTLEVGAIPKPVEPVTVDIGLRDGIRLGSDGGDRTGAAGSCATERIDLTNIPKPCTINLTKAKWAYATTSETGHIMTCARNASGTNLVVNYTNTSIGSGYFSVVSNNTQYTDLTVTVTSDEVAEICFSGTWASLNYSDSADSFAAANTKATLTYIPNA